MKQRQKGTVLVVGNEAPDLAVLFKPLRQAGLRVLVAADEAGALRRSRRSPPDLVVLDVSLPGTNGFELYSRLRQTSRNADLPVVFLITAPGPVEGARALDMQVADYIIKPVDPQQVVSRVLRHLLLHSLRWQLEEQNAQVQWLSAELARESAEHQQAEEELKKHHDHLEALVAERTQRLRALTARLAEAEQEERHQLACELHDQVGQDLAALSLNLKALQQYIRAHPGNPAETADRALARLADSSALLKATVRRIRNVMDYLRPPALEEHGLMAALRWHTTQFTSRTNIPVTVQGKGPSPRLAAKTETALFRIAQEALNNVARHARATRVLVTVEQAPGRVCLVVADDGIGFDPEHPAQPVERQPWGLLTMAERAEAVGGRFRIESAPGRGTRVVVEVAP